MSIMNGVVSSKIHDKRNDFNFELERVIHGASSQIPMLKFLTTHHPKVPPLGHDPVNRIKILFNMFPIFNLCKHTQ